MYRISISGVWQTADGDWRLLPADICLVARGCNLINNYRVIWAMKVVEVSQRVCGPWNVVRYFTTVLFRYAHLIYPIPLQRKRW
jgi:hypothetical protein